MADADRIAATSTPVSGPTPNPVEATPAPVPGTRAARPPRRLGLGMFKSLQSRNYRLLWLGTLISQSGDWMDQTALAWLVLTLTDSPASLGIMQFCRAAPILVFTLIGGALADRFERRRMLFVTQSASMLLAFLLAGLVSFGHIQFWMILVIAALRGISMSFNQPTRQALISELVPPEDLLNAVALNSATMNACRIIGPAIGGVLIWQFGVAEAFYINGFSFLATLIALQTMHIPPREVDLEAARSGLTRSLLDGLAYVRSNPVLLTLVTIALVPMVFGMPYITMLSVYARDVLGMDSRAYGWMLSATGAGALVGALTVASLENFRYKGRLMLAAMFAFGVMLILFAQSRALLLSLALLLFVGAASTTYMANNNTLLQLHAEPRYRGRVMSTMFLNRGLVPLGTMFAGFGAQVFGAPAMTTFMALVVVVLAVVIAIKVPSVRELE